MTIGRFTVMSIHTYTRRYALFLTGVILSATGIAFITRAGLGTSPVSGLTGHFSESCPSRYPAFPWEPTRFYSI